MQNNLIGGNELRSTDRFDTLRSKHVDHQNAITNRQHDPLEQQHTVQISRTEFFMSSVSEDGGYKILAQALSVEFSLNAQGDGSFNRASNQTSNSFRPPSPLDVANKVLGFVENRLNSELESGADSERISSLISQAREGVQKGFSQARKDIESLDLMTEKLGSEIDKGFTKINQGLDEFDERFSPENSNAAGVEERREDQNEVPVRRQVGVVSGSQYQQETVSHSDSEVINSVGFSGRSVSQSESDFSLITQDGDTVTIRFAQSGSEQFQLEGQSFLYSAGQSQAFQIEINGELDDGELTAITDLLAQVGQVSELFFEDRFQDAFAAALNVGFDASEIASFSLDLSQSQYQEVQTYERLGSALGQGVVQRNQALVDVVALFENMYEKSQALLEQFDELQFDFQALITESIDRIAAEKYEPALVAKDDLASFGERLLELLAD